MADEQHLDALSELAGVVLLTEPWQGGTDPVGVAFALAAAACWAAYILLTQRVGDQIPGVAGVAVSMPVAGLVASLLVAPGMVGSDVFGSLTWELLLAGLGLAVLLPVVPFTLELLALRRLTTAAFGTLMALEPAFALLVGCDHPADIDAALAPVAAVVVDHADQLAALLLLDRPQHVVRGPVADMPAHHPARLVERGAGIDAPVAQVRGVAVQRVQGLEVGRPERPQPQPFGFDRRSCLADASHALHYPWRAQ